MALDRNTIAAPHDAGALLKIVEMGLRETLRRRQAGVLAALRGDSLTVRAAQRCQQVVRQAVDVEPRRRGWRRLLGDRRSRDRSDLGLRRGFRRRGDRSGRVQSLAELGHLLLDALRQEILLPGESVVVFEVPIGGPGVFAPLAVDRPLVIAELGQASLRARDRLHLLLAERDGCCGRRRDGVSDRCHGLLRGAGPADPLQPLGAHADASLRRPAFVVAT